MQLCLKFCIRVKATQLTSSFVRFSYKWSLELAYFEDIMKCCSTLDISFIQEEADNADKSKTEHISLIDICFFFVESTQISDTTILSLHQETYFVFLDWHNKNAIAGSLFVYFLPHTMADKRAWILEFMHMALLSPKGWK